MGSFKCFRETMKEWDTNHKDPDHDSNSNLVVLYSLRQWWYLKELIGIIGPQKLEKSYELPRQKTYLDQK